MSIDSRDPLPQPDVESADSVRRRAASVLRPEGALRSLDELAIWLAGWQRSSNPTVENVLVVIFAGDHGVAREGVSAYPNSVTMAMVEAIRSGVATVSVMATEVGAQLEVVELGLGSRASGNIRIEAALTTEQFESAFMTGRSAVPSESLDLFIPGEVGIANTTSAAAVAYGLFGGDARDWVGRGTGIDDQRLDNKVRVVEEAVARVGRDHPMEILRQLGGWELAAIAGSIYEARLRSVPVLLDGFVVTAAAMALEEARPGLLDHCWPGHVSAEKGHRLLVSRLGHPPLLDLELRLGEASGALAAVPLARLAAKLVVDVATFEEMGLG